ncbi:facilitated trehalose transporter Tret1-2 homolog [Ischnura elegans]|uniref:facilitated trehalose transporter Tret1-2 homolog n=1 Tax=Ischnura elegans TaxID=197161 RepID=UPI001ED87C97|nr:facilitated trehalose transporter Tret1-2 homolog [Ischnura elegans]
MPRHPEKHLRNQNSRTALTPTIAADGSIDYSSVTWKFPQYLATIFATFGAMAAGTTLAWTSPALPILKAAASTGNGIFGLDLTVAEGSWVGSILTLGACIGALPAGPIADQVGRKRLLTATALPFLFSWLLVAVAPNVHFLYCARFLAGLATGAVSAVVPIYVGEIAERSIRGTLGSFFQLMLTLGILLSYAVGALSASYGTLTISSAAVSALFLLGAVWMPESPQYLLAWGRREEAVRSLMWLRGVDNPIAVDMDVVAMEHDLSVASKEALDRGGSGSVGVLKELLTSPRTRKAAMVTLGLMVFQQLSGVNAVIFYTESIFALADTRLSAAASAAIVGAVQVVVTALAAVLVERVGRRFLLCFSSLAGAISLCALGAFFHLQSVASEGSTMQGLSWLPLVSLAAFVVAFSLGLGPLPWVMMSELFPSSVKGSASALAVAVNWMLAFAVTKNFSVLTSSLGSDGTFWGFSIVCALAVLFVAFFVPETKGKTEQEIHESMEGRRRQWRYSPGEPVKLVSPI